MGTNAKIILILLCTAPAARSQTVSVGLVTGNSFLKDSPARIPITAYKPFNIEGYPNTLLSPSVSTSVLSFSPEQPGPSVGPVIDFAFRNRWSVELSTIRGSKTTPAFVPDPSAGSSFFDFAPPTTHLWQIPLLFKYRLPPPVRKLPIRPVLSAGPVWRFMESGTDISHSGAAAGVGLAYQHHRLIAEPTLRCTRWWNTSSAANQWEFLVAFRYALKN